MVAHGFQFGMVPYISIMIRRSSPALPFLVLVLATGTSRAQFGTPQVVHAPQSMDWNSTVMSYHDIDGDGVLDVVMCNGYLGNRFGALCYVKGNGDGTFAMEPSIIDPDVTSARSFTVVDTDSDGDLDIFDMEGFFHMNNGDGTFAESVEVGSFGTLHDLNGDGLLDLVHIGPIWLNVRFQTVNGSWPSQISVQSELTNGLSLLRVDLDGNGDLELIAQLGTNAHELTYDGSDLQFGPAFGVADERLEFAADLDGDGDQDIVTARDMVFENRTEFSFIINTGNGLSWAPPQALSFDARTYTHGDYDMDGDEDIVCMSDSFFTHFENDGSGTTFIPHLIPYAGETYRGTARSWSLHTLDLDSDGDLDITDGRDRFLNVGSHQFEGPFDPDPEWSATDGYVPHWCDLDLDGLTDVVISLSNAVLWRRNLGSGQFGRLSTLLRADMGDVGMIVMEDLDHDGLEDIVVHSQGHPLFYWFKNTGGATFGSKNQILQDPASGQGVLGLYDLDADDDRDIVTFDPVTGVIAWLANDGAGSFGPQTTSSITLNIEETLEVNDLDGDGAAELLVYDNSDQVDPEYGQFVHQNNGDGTWGPAQRIETTNEIANHLRSFADMNGDGRKDLLLVGCFNCEEATPPILLYHPNLGNGQWGAYVGLVWAQPLLAQVIDVRDMDGDTDLDLLVASTPEQDITTYSYIPCLGGSVYDTLHQLVTGRVYSAQWAALLNSQYPLDIGYFDIDTGTMYLPNYTDSEYQLRGVLFVDSDGNGQRDVGEPGIGGTQVSATPMTVSAWSGITGEYVIPATPGTFVVNRPPALDPAIWTLTTSAAVHTVESTSEEPVQSGLDFGFIPAVDTSLVRVTLSAGTGPCASIIPIGITVTNHGTRIESGSISVHIDASSPLMNIVPTSGTIEDTIITWHFTRLSYGSSIQFRADVELPSFLLSGTLLQYRASVTTDGSTATSQDSLEWQLACSYDPNDKQVAPVGYGTHGAIADSTQHLDYTIRFQNTGTGPAYHVRLVDQLSPELDRSRIEVIGASHTPDLITLSDDGELQVRFQYIMLPDSTSDRVGSQGFLSLRIAVDESAGHMTAIPNSASIFFDLNAPVLTNTTLTTLVDCALWQPIIDNPLPNVLQATEGDRYQWFIGEEAIGGETERLLTVEALGEYSVEVTSEYGCSALSDPFIVISLAVQEHDMHRLIVLPNPFCSTTVIRSNRPIMPDDRIVLCNVEGRILRSLTGNGSMGVEIARDDLSSGLYFARILSSSGTTEATVRLIVE